jgi:hypothetical protein
MNRSIHGKADVEIPEHLTQAIDDAVSHSLSTELNARGLLLARASAASATVDAARSGAALLHRVVAHCYPESRYGGRAMAVEFEGDHAAGRVELALAFGSVTASLLTPPKRTDRRQPTGSVDLLCAVFNLGIGLVDGLCDGAPQLGLRLLQIVQAINLSGAARERWPRGQLRSALPTSLAADPTVAFTARIIEAFFDLLHSVYPGDGGSTLRRHVGAQLEAALEAERQSVDRSVELAARDQLIECSRRTSVLPFQIIELLTTGAQPMPSPTAGTLLGEAMWRIDDLVDLTQDARLDALNALLLAAIEKPRHTRSANPSGVAALERVLTSQAIPVAAAQAAECLDAGLKASSGGEAAIADRRLFLSFVQRYAGIAPSADLRPGP